MAGLSWLPAFPPLSRAQQQQQQQKISNLSSFTDTFARATSNPLPTSPSTTETIPRSPSATATKPRSPASASVPDHTSPRPKAVQRMSSFLGLGRSSSASPPPPEMGRSSGAGGGGYRARQLDWEHVGEEEEQRREQRAPERLDTWYNPSLMQMVETVQTVMMTKRDMSVGIPAVYNSYILCMIEGIGKMTRHLRKKEEELEELKGLREKELEEFRGISEDWIKREKDYKAEIKRLELILARESSEGVASVALARHGSLVNRSDSKRFQAQVKRLSNSRDQADGLAGDLERKEDDASSTNGTVGNLRPVETLWRGSIPRGDELISREMAKRDKHISRLLKDQGKSLNPQARARESASRQQGFATKDSDKKSTKRKDPLVSKVAIQAALQRDRGHHASSEAPESKHTPMTNMLQPLPSGGNEGVRDDLVLRAGTGGKVHGNSGDPRGLGSSGQLQASQLSSNPQPTVASSTQTMHPEATCLSRASFRADGDVHDQSTRRTKASDGPNRVRSYSFAEGEDESLEFFTLTSETRTSPSKYPAILAEGDNGMRQRPSVLADVAAVVDEMEHTGIRTQGSGRLSTVQLSDRAIPAVATTAPIAPSTSSGSVIWLGGQGSGITRSHMVESSVWNQVSNGVDKGVGIMPSAISKRNGQEISASRVGFTADDRKAFPTLDLGSVSDSDSSSGDSTLMPVHRERVRGSSAQHGKSVVT